MKYISRTLLLLLLPTVLFAQAKSSNSLPEKSIKYGIDKAYEPYEFVRNDGEVAGFNVDIIKAIGKELNWEISIYADDWKKIRRKLEVTNELDVSAYFKTEDREDSIMFSRPISLVYYSIFTRSDKEPVQDLFSLSGKKVAIQEFTIVEEYFNQFGFLELEELSTYSSESAAIDAVVKGDADCAITSFMTTNYKMKAEKITNIQSSSDPVFINEYCFVVNKRDSLLLDSLNWGIRLVKASGQYDSIYQKWLTPKKSWWQENKDLFTLLLIIFSLILILVVVYIFFLKKLLKHKSYLASKEFQDRTTAELELQESENMRKKIEVFTSVMLLETDLEHKIIQAPPLFNSTLGLDDNELLGVNIHQLLTSHSVAKDKEIKTSLMQKEVSFLDAEYKFKTSSNHAVWMNCSTSLLFDTNQKIIGFKQFLHDVTPLKQANANLRDLNAELANFMYKTSHDVRGPIANVLGLVNLANMTTQDQEVLSFLRLIEKSIQKLERIFDNFKEVSFILHGDLNITTFDIPELIYEVSDSVFLKRNKDRGRAKIEVQILADNQMITSDRALLKRLFFQIIENVFEHNNYYETQLIVSYEHASESHYKIYFEDDGIGIPKDLQKKVFEVFFKGKRSDINVGMGLYMAKKVISRLGGELSLQSERGEGTRIEITLPTPGKAKSLTNS